MTWQTEEEGGRCAHMSRPTTPRADLSFSVRAAGLTELIMVAAGAVAQSEVLFLCGGIMAAMGPALLVLPLLHRDLVVPPSILRTKSFLRPSSQTRINRLLQRQVT